MSKPIFLKLKACFFCLLLTIPVYAQQSYTDPSSNDLKLANKAVSSCPILSELIAKNDKNDIPASEAFSQLQKTEDGKLLIDNEACRDSILEFVSSLCSSDSSTNDLYCEKVGIQKSDYKQFGQSTIDNLDIELTDTIPFEPIQKETSKLKFLAASTLFYLSPVKKLRFASLVGQRVKPVLNGALLLLATLGLSSCDDLDITEPLTPAEPRVQDGIVEKSKVFNNSQTPTPPAFTILYDDTNNPILPTETLVRINIEFSSDVVLLKHDGSSWVYSEITRENVHELLSMEHEFFGDVSSLLFSGLFPITVNTVQEKIVISLDLAFLRKNFGTYTFSLKGYAKKEDVQTGRIHAENASEYYQRTYKEEDFVISISCDFLDMSLPMLAAPALDQEIEIVKTQEPWVCGTKHEVDEDAQRFLDFFHQDEPTTEALGITARKADPNKTYVIDIGFIVSYEAENAPFSGGLSGITERLNQYYIPKVNAIYQNSGVNVEFRAKAVRPFSDFSNYLACPNNIPYWDGLGPKDSNDILRELTPIIKYQHDVDFVVGLKGYGAHSKQNGRRIFGRVSDIRMKNWSARKSSHLASTLTLNISVPGHQFTKAIAHEIGHLLGLWHGEETLSEYPHPDNFTGYGHGYRTTVRSDFNPGTIMSYAGNHDNREAIPFFSSNRTATLSEICQSNVSDLPFCQYSSRDGLGFHSLRIGSSLANSSEALQYTIEDASNYSTFYTSASSNVLTQH